MEKIFVEKLPYEAAEIEIVEVSKTDVLTGSNDLPWV